MFRKALGPLLKARISTSACTHAPCCHLRILNGHTACGCEQGDRRRRGLDSGRKRRDRGSYIQALGSRLHSTYLRVASVKSNDLKGLWACCHHPRAFR